MRNTKTHDKQEITSLFSSIGRHQIAIAELEGVGLPLRIINLLEDYLGAIWLEDLLQYTPQQLREKVPNLGDKSLRLIMESLDALGTVLDRMPRETRPTAAPVMAIGYTQPTNPGFSDCAS